MDFDFHPHVDLFGNHAQNTNLGWLVAYGSVAAVVDFLYVVFARDLGYYNWVDGSLSADVVDADVLAWYDIEIAVSFDRNLLAVEHRLLDDWVLLQMNHNLDPYQSLYERNREARK